MTSKPPTIPFGIVACTFSDNLFRNSCIYRILLALRMGAVRDAIYFHRFSVFVWTGGNDSNTLSVDAYFGGKRRGKMSVLKKYPDMCGRGLNPSTVSHCVQPPCPSNKLGKLTQLGLRQRKEDCKPCMTSVTIIV